MSYSARILADSISPDEVRLLTLEVTFPRFILAEVNTHRMLSRNSASSRAIPTEKILERVIKNPFVPETFNKRVKGMGVGERLADEAQEASRKAWLHARDKSVAAAQVLIDMDVDKSRVNRLLEPFMWHTAIISATEWDNFFALRDHPAAQPEFQMTAQLMKEAIADSTPQELDYEQWHLPLVSREELADLCENRDSETVERYKMISASRCARVSFDKHTDSEPHEASIERAERLMTSGHLSPFEHVARPMGEPGLGYLKPSEAFMGNFRGWTQFRKEIPNESNFGALTAQV